mmetsp:Transcript_99240/g.319840  ORF Transcript_99240/g.319840 Transcript_99240/m.319840 type:complete len:506 (+) Transcript_99240:66-1583(+)
MSLRFVSSTLALLFVCGEGREESGELPAVAKTIAGVPVRNYNLARAAPKLADGTPAAWTKWILVLKPNVSDSHLQQFCTGSLCVCALQGHPSRGGVPFVSVHCSENDMEQVLLAHPGHAEFIEPNIQLSVVPAMPAPPQEGQKSQLSASWGLDRIGEPECSRRGEGTHIYVLDTGIYVQHEDFEGRAIPTLDVSSGTLVECHGDLNCAVDRMGHGTHCAGIAAGKQYGVAKGATLHAMKVLSDQGSGEFSWSISALDWVVSFGERPAVVSMSLGGAGRLSSMRTAIDAAATAGVTVVVAAGNEQSDACTFTPAFVPSALTVGASEISDQPAPYSNWGFCVDMYAPGSGITSAWIGSPLATRILSGTSMACPHVSGGAALLLGEHPAWNSGQVRAALLASGEKGALRNLWWFFWTNVLLSVRDATVQVAHDEALEKPGLSWTSVAAFCAMVSFVSIAAGGIVGFCVGKGFALPGIGHSHSGRELLHNTAAEMVESQEITESAEVMP